MWCLFWYWMTNSWIRFIFCLQSKACSVDWCGVICRSRFRSMYWILLEFYWIWTKPTWGWLCLPLGTRCLIFRLWAIFLAWARSIWRWQSAAGIWASCLVCASGLELVYWKKPGMAMHLNLICCSRNSGWITDWIRVWFSFSLESSCLLLFGGWLISLAMGGTSRRFWLWFMGCSSRAPPGSRLWKLLTVTKRSSVYQYF